MIWQLQPGRGGGGNKIRRRWWWRQQCNGAIPDCYSLHGGVYVLDFDEGAMDMGGLDDSAHVRLQDREGVVHHINQNRCQFGALDNGMYIYR